jgi:fatty-acyl-CoA synthase
MAAQDAGQARTAGRTHPYWPADTTEPVLETTVGDALRQAAATWPDHLALVEGVADPAARRRWSFAALLADAECVARALLGRFHPGDMSRSGRRTAPSGYCWSMAPPSPG